MKRPSTADLLMDFYNSLSPGQTFTLKDAINYCRENRFEDPPTVGTVENTLHSMTTNIPGRRTNVRVSPQSNNDQFFRIRDSKGNLTKDHRLYLPGVDPTPLYFSQEAYDEMRSISPFLPEEENDDTLLEEDNEVASERILRDALVEDPNQIELGFKVIGVEYIISKESRIDIFGKRANGEYGFVETKIHKGTDRTVGQTCRYQGEIQEKFNVKVVKAWIICKKQTRSLKLAVRNTINVTVREYNRPLISLKDAEK